MGQNLVTYRNERVARTGEEEGGAVVADTVGEVDGYGPGRLPTGRQQCLSNSSSNRGTYTTLNRPQPTTGERSGSWNG